MIISKKTSPAGEVFLIIRINVILIWYGQEIR